MPQPLLRGEAYCSALVGSSAGGRAGSARTGSHVETLYTRVGMGPCDLCWDMHLKNNFGPGRVEVGHALRQMQLANKVGVEEVISNDDNDAWKSSMRWAEEIHILFKSET